jgi:hypothetical protein
MLQLSEDLYLDEDNDFLVFKNKQVSLFGIPEFAREFTDVSYSYKFLESRFGVFFDIDDYDSWQWCIIKIDEDTYICFLEDDSCLIMKGEEVFDYYNRWNPIDM